MNKNPFLIKLISTGFYIGCLPIPGTMASLATVGFFLILIRLKGFALIIPSLFSLIYLVLVFLIIYLGLLVCGPAQDIFGKKDDGRIVIDEAAGMLIALWGLVSTVGRFPYLYIIIAFAMFRFFDILKPYPINRLERLPGSTGIMADDIAAGFFANLATRMILLLFL